MNTRRDVFQAIADPTRRAIISLIAKDTMNLNAIADNFGISRPAISQQIRILVECGLVSIRKKGRENYCEANLQQLDEVRDWADTYKRMWEERLDDLGLVLAEMKAKEKKKEATSGSSAGRGRKKPAASAKKKHTKKHRI